jgi:hypothetical protein
MVKPAIEINNYSNTNSDKSQTRVYTILSLICLFFGILLIYTFSFLKFLYMWTDLTTTDGPSGLIPREEILQFLSFTGFDSQIVRYNFIYLIICVFVSSLLLLLIKNREIKSSDVKRSNKTVIIHDDVIQVVPEEKSDGSLTYHPEKMVPADGFKTIEDLFKRRGGFRIIMKISNYIALFAIFGMIWVFFRNSSLAPVGIYYGGYIYTDEGLIIIDLSMAILLLYFLLRCPDFVKSLAATGFKRIYMKKIHIHETFIGILLALGGIFLVINGAGPGAFFERMTGIVVLILGVFMMGRDWKDLIEGKFLSD